MSIFIVLLIRNLLNLNTLDLLHSILNFIEKSTFFHLRNELLMESTINTEKNFEIKLEKPIKYGKIDISFPNQIFEEFVKFPVDGLKFVLSGRARGFLKTDDPEKLFIKKLKAIETNEETPSQKYRSFLTLITPLTDPANTNSQMLESAVDIVYKSLELKIYEKPTFNKDDYFDSAFKKYDLGDFKGAIADYTKVIEIDVNNVSAYYNRGISRQNLGNHAGAIQDFARVIELKPNYAPAYNNRGVAKKKVEDFESAINDFTKAIELDPNYTVAYFNRGLAKKNINDIIGEIEDFNKAIELDNNFAPAYYNRALELKIMGEFKDAIIDFDKAIELNPKDISAYLNRAYCRDQIGDYVGARNDKKKVEEIRGK